MRYRLVKLLALGSVICSPAIASVVRVTTNHGTGQGWMFLDYDGHCKVVTPAHVVQLIDKRAAVEVSVTDNRFGTLLADPPMILSQPDDFDVALVLLRGADDPAICGSGRLSSIGVAQRIRSLTEARIETTGKSETLMIPVRLSGRVAGDDKPDGTALTEEGSRFSVQAIGARVVGGWSGSAVVDDGGLLGLVTSQDGDEETLVVRADVIRALVDKASARPGAASHLSGQRLEGTVFVSKGSTPDLASGQNRILASDGAGWSVVPDNHRIVFDVVLRQPASVTAVSMYFSSTGNAVQGMDVSVSPAPTGQDWTSLHYCSFQKTTGPISCSVVKVAVTCIRISMTTTANDPVSISKFSLSN